jgi:hypothetical protein
LEALIYSLCDRYLVGAGDRLCPCGGVHESVALGSLAGKTLRGSSNCKPLGV